MKKYVSLLSILRDLEFSKKKKNKDLAGESMCNLAKTK